MSPHCYSSGSTLSTVILALILIACEVNSNDFSKVSTVQQPTIVNAASPGFPSPTWNSIVQRTAVPAGWAVRPCGGAFLCVERNGNAIGSVELGIYLIEADSTLYQTLVAQGLVPENLVEQSSGKTLEIVSALRAWVAEHYQVIREDRQPLYGTDTTFSLVDPEVVKVGEWVGLRYGFKGVHRQSGLVERHIGYVALQGRSLYVITTTVEPGAVTGNFTSDADLQAFEPYLTEIVANLNLTAPNP